MNHETHTHTSDNSIVIANWKWMVDFSFCLVFVILNGVILISEIKRRKKSTNIKSVSKYTKMWPIVCITSGLFVEIFGLVAFFPGVCHFSRQLEFFLSGVQGVAMGFFQLSRLYYLYTSTSNGYSNIIFIFMYGVGIIILTTITMVSFLVEHINYCSLDSELNYIETSEYFYWFKGNSDTVIYTFLACLCIYILWDVLTLSMYVRKLIPFYYGKQTTDEKVNDKQNSIKFLLYKIVILTFMYQITIVLVINDLFIEMVSSSKIIHIDSILVFIFLEGLLSTSMSYAIFLMQQHNQQKYKQFLKMVHFLKCDMCICCCCRSVIRYELQLQKSQQSELTRMTSVLELAQPTQTDMLLSKASKVPDESKDTTVVTHTVIPTHSSKNQARSRGSNHFNETKSNDDMSSAPIGKPTLQRDKVSELGNTDSSSSSVLIAIH